VLSRYYPTAVIDVAKIATGLGSSQFVVAGAERSAHIFARFHLHTGSKSLLVALCHTDKAKMDRWVVERAVSDLLPRY
jgi:hypothetical protein